MRRLVNFAIKYIVSVPLFFPRQVHQRALRRCSGEGSQILEAYCSVRYKAGYNVTTHPAMCGKYAAIALWGTYEEAQMSFVGLISRMIECDPVNGSKSWSGWG
jgi:hypothetical protein